MLELKNITKYFGGLCAVNEVSFTVEEGEIVGLIGPNGAGKTTIFNCITGVYPVSAGEIIFDGRKITGLSPHKICKLGIARTFQIVRPFFNLTVLENVLSGIIFGKSRRGFKFNVRDEALKLLDIVRLADKAEYLAKQLTFEQLRKLELARAIATQPKIVLIDEIAAGLNPLEVIEATEIIKRIRDEFGVGIIWIEHVMRAVMATAERVIVLHHGQKIAEGAPKEVTQDHKVIEAYLGEKYIFG